MSASRKFAVGKVGEPVAARFDTEEEAVTWIVEREKIDPEGVFRGDYFLDAPAEDEEGEEDSSLKFSLSILCNNAAFEHRAAELARFLRETARELEAGEDRGMLRDSNGNTVGAFSLEEEDTQRQRIVFVFDPSEAEEPSTYEAALNEAAEEANISTFAYVQGYEGYRLEKGS